MSHTFCVSEKEASTKRCPMTFSAPEIRFPNGDGWREAGPWNCVGSDCMAWRWVETNLNDQPGEELRPSHNTHGYCGMAGKPWWSRR